MKTDLLNGCALGTLRGFPARRVCNPNLYECRSFLCLMVCTGRLATHKRAKRVQRESTRTTSLGLTRVRPGERYCPRHHFGGFTPEPPARRPVFCPLGQSVQHSRAGALKKTASWERDQRISTRVRSEYPHVAKKPRFVTGAVDAHVGPAPVLTDPPGVERRCGCGACCLRTWPI